MKGLIFNAVENAVTEHYGEDTWDDLIDHAGVVGAYTAVGSYPDAELFALLAAAVDLTGAARDDVLRMVGRHALPTLVSQVAELVDREATVFDFLASIDEIIHVEVRKLAPDAHPPAIIVEQLSDDLARLTYQSQRGLGALAEGLILGSGDLFDQPVVVEPQGELAGDESSVFHIRLVSA